MANNPLWYKELPDNGALEVEVIQGGLNVYSCAKEDSILNVLDRETTIDLLAFLSDSLGISLYREGETKTLAETHRRLGWS